jgi:hypothetical protein
MRVNPADAASMQAAIAYEGDNIDVRHDGRLVHLLVVCEKVRASPKITDQQLTVNEVVSADLVAAQQLL